MLKIVSDFLGTFLNVLTCIVFARIVLKKGETVSRKIKAIIIIFTTSLLYFFCYFNVTVLKTFIILLMYLYLFKRFYDLDISKTSILGFFYFVFQVLADFITIEILTFIVGERNFYLNFAGGLISNFIVFILIVLLSLIFHKIIYKFLNVKIKYRLIFLLFLSVLCIIIIFYATFQLGTNAIDKFLCVFIILIIFFTLSYSFIQIYKNQMLINEYDNLLSFIRKYEQEIDVQRIIRHETKNQLLTIKSKIIDCEKTNEILDYIDVILNDDRKVNHSEYAKLQYLPSNGIKGLFYFKISLAQDRGIVVNVNISKTIENSFLKELNSSEFNQIGKILGVFLDNAIEAAELSSDKSIGIEVFKKRNLIIFIISNTYNSNIKLFGKSSKGSTRGYGLLLVNNILNSNAKLGVFTEVTDELYTKKLLIKK